MFITANLIAFFNLTYCLNLGGIIVVLYLKRIFRDSNILSFASAKRQKNPDLIIETIDNPILVEIGINKNTTKQISKSRIKHKYEIIINSKIKTIELHNNIVIIPLKYFLLLLKNKKYAYHWA